MDNKTSPSCSQSLEVPLKPESSNDHLSVVRHSSLNREQPDLNKSRGEEEFKTNPDILIKNTEENGYPVEDSQGQKGVSQGPLNWFTNSFGSEIKSEDSQPQSSILTDSQMVNSDSDKLLPQSPTFVKIVPQQKELVANVEELEPEVELETAVALRLREKSIDEKLEEEKAVWPCFGPGWTRVMVQIRNEKDQRHHELLVINRRKQKLSEWEKRLEQMQYDLTAREARTQESEHFLPLARKLREMKLTLEDILPFIQTVNEVAQMQNMDIKNAILYVDQELRQLGGIQRQIERANQELALINMTTIKKEEALTVLIDLLKRGVTESQIAQLINFAGEWNQWHQTTNNGSSNGNLQQPNNPARNNGNNSSNFSDLIKLNLLKATTTNMLNRMETKQITRWEK
jgi:hypothetical protein